MFSVLGGLLERYSGKKFAALVLGMGAVAYLVDSYLGLDDPTPHTAYVYVAAVAGLCFVSGAAAIGIGIADAGQARAEAAGGSDGQP